MQTTYNNYRMLSKIMNMNMSKNFENISLHKLTFDESSFSKEDDKLYNNNPNPNKISTFINGVLNKANLDENDLVYFTTPEDNEFFYKLCTGKHN